MDRHSLERLEFHRVTSGIAEHAESDEARERLAGWSPLADAAARATETALLAEAIRRQSEPGAWCAVGRGHLARWLEADSTDPLDGPALVSVLGWLEAGDSVIGSWREPGLSERHPGLARRALSIPDLTALRERLARSLDSDGSVRDSASPALARARADLAHGERRLHGELERWARAFGETSYVTRHGDRFVALVPAAGFPRRKGLVHDVSGSGQSLFVEPLEACEDNNRLIELRAAALEEERRVVRELAGEVRAKVEAVRALEDALVHLDSLRARARWASALGAIALLPGGEVLRLLRARHPLLASGERRDRLVPLDLDLGSARVLLVSGPNMGGKSVLLKTVGLAMALAHAALPVPAAEGSAVPEIDTLLVDLGDEQSVDRGLSTFAAHLETLRTMAEQASPRSLLLCDELGAGTDPEEGAALGRALLEHFAARRAWCVLTSHLGSLKRAAGEIDGVLNGSLEFDLETLTPRYRFIPGIPGASHALAVAERLGFPAPLLERARELTPEETGALERLLGELSQARNTLEQRAAALDAAREDAESAASAHRAATEDGRRAMSELRRRLTAESDGLLSRARELWQTLLRESRRAEKSRAEAGRIKGEIEGLERSLDALGQEAGAAAGDPAPVPAGPITAGQRVRVVDLGVEAEVVSGPDADGRVVVRRGSWSIHTHASRLAAAGGEREAAPKPGREGATSAAGWDLPEEAPALELDLRGQDVEEALRELDRGLDRASLAGLHEIRVVHGVGRGVLRAAVERHLRGHPQVESQRLGVVGEGGRGVTVARLR